MGIGFIAFSHLSLTDESRRTFIACCLVFGLLALFLLSYLVKTKRLLLIFQENGAFNLVTETLLMVGAAVGILFLYREKDRISGILILLTILCICLICRLLMGRLCGCIGLMTSFVIFSLLTNRPVDTSEYIHILCFLIPYLLFLFTTGTLSRFFLKNRFLLVSSYVLLGVVFAFAAFIYHPVLLLLAGCALMLIFSKAEKKEYKILSSGIALTCIILLTTAIIAISAILISGTPLQTEAFACDETLLASGTVSKAASFLYEKYKRSLNSLYYSFPYGIFPAFLSFLSAAAGYYTIRRKKMELVPLCMLFTILMGTYALSNISETIFYPMICFLPIFSAFSFSAMLLPDTEYTTLASESHTEDSGNTSGSEAEPEPDNFEKQPVITKKEKNAQHETDLSIQNIEEESVMSNPYDEIPEWKVSDRFLSDQTKSPEEPAVSQSDESPLLLSDQPVSTEETHLETETMWQDKTGENDTDEDETMLSDLLNRLDISDNIRRMNKSAREDMADIIERDDEQIELSEAIPAEECLEADHISELPRYEKPDFSLQPLEQPLNASYSEISEYDTVPTINDLERKWRNVNEKGNESANPDTDEAILPDFQDEDMALSDDMLLEKTTEKAEEDLSVAEERNTGGFAYSLEDVIGIDDAAISLSTEDETDSFSADENDPVSDENTLTDENSLAFSEKKNPVLSVHSEEVVRKNNFGKRTYHKITLG